MVYTINGYKPIITKEGIDAAIDWCCCNGGWPVDYTTDTPYHAHIRQQASKLGINLYSVRGVGVSESETARESYYH